MRDAERGEIKFQKFSAHGRSDPGERGNIFYRLKIFRRQRAPAGERDVFAFCAANDEAGIRTGEFQGLQQRKISPAPPDGFRLAWICNPRRIAGVLQWNERFFPRASIRIAAVRRNKSIRRVSDNVGRENRHEEKKFLNFIGISLGEKNSEMISEKREEAYHLFLVFHPRKKSPRGEGTGRFVRSI